ncbi:hypothetical protein OOK39_02080 [Streptomyces sp. NBC_00264]|uniref:phage terminase small subunit n=1 Tax=unclassified Streptomyces TaxID=2593676 RepID=UPI0022584871|nr:MULTISPECIES: hypothetical protein [unclassified Streptomyces]MCX5158090.1 hypothetical protein [Streptomyces sp. NBC_00305]MCX5216613.1 hypothetical protein [Streptomyces sp. NBC_00264]
MAGRGPQPKDPSRRARGNKDPVPQTVLRFEHAEPPDLPTLQVLKDGDLVEHQWPARTLDWWEMWKASPQAEHFSSTDWDFLLDTAVVHARLWSGEMSAAGELRLRVAKFGATPEDRARLRMQFAQADEADSKRPEGRSARERRGTLHALPPPKAEGG